VALPEYQNAGRGNWLFREDYYKRGNTAKQIFRLQVYPVYKVPQERESFQRFLETGKRDIDPDDAPGLVRLRERIAAGSSISRVYVVEPPFTDYQRYVFTFYHHTCEAGEDLRVIDLSQQANPGLPNYDFMLIDNETVIRIHYNEDDGAIIGPELLPDADVSEYTRYRDLAMSNSVPFLEYEKTIDF
jgi:hypothetical protein